MLKIEDIQTLIKEIDNSSIDEFTYETDGSKLKLKKQMNKNVISEEVTSVKQPEPTVATKKAETLVEDVAQPTAVDTKVIGDYEIKSPMVGTFYNSSSPDKDAYVSVGDKVNADTVVCIVEAMKLFNEIEADAEGEIVEILVNNGELVEYGQPLFRVKTK
ncbi:acetyl-CoA carboxylase, biotin carboxyl carrier protein [Paraliobacillus quinghaiensis]|uniref:Biotin carboxyl carrier protein of acetyl-CoA carboxylase n=1 Tax=Paraliobacillus quinghaiensis TaxID=470815 RepID=A0A917TVY9_9BACI|nr:acetyl-CoA carboxylase biotin carboxyl carrier protein [Paraliobacillus quinghaiensis]GGM40257.1 acetyl-CoA carboxylase, biotin carboxyl carrier protein [Paraliobacillus quinghaiensis]